jgi:carbon monoxide dehydrogenase subunit G
MRIENTVEVDAPLERVWALVNDIPRVAPCMPGAALTGAGDDGTYEGTVAVKLGPLRMSYKGKVSVDEVDDANHSARLTASGKDTKGAGTARATVETRLEPAGETHTRLHVTSDVQLTGKVASFGRGGAINDVATRLFGQFADCLRATLESEAPTSAAVAGGTGPVPAEAGAGTGAAGVADAGASTPTEEAPAPPSEPVAAGDGSTATVEGATAATASATPTPATPTPAPPAPSPVAATTTPSSAPASPAPAAAPRPVEALDAGSLVGTVIKGRFQALFAAIAGFFRRLFGGRRSSG